MISSTSNYSQPCVPMCPSTRFLLPRPLLPTVEESILEINNDGVSLLQSGNNKAAMIRLARCLAIMRVRDVEGDKEVHYKITRSLRNNILPETLNSSRRYIFTAPLFVAPHISSDCSNCCSSNDAEQSTCKLLSLVLFNLSLAHHMHALELLEAMQYKAQNELQLRQGCDLLEKSLRLYELCHSSLVFTNSGLLCSDLSIAVIVTNNVGEIHKLLRQQSKKNQHEHTRTAMACSEQLIQIFMFFTANGESNRLEGFGDILSNAMATLNGPPSVAPAA